MRSPSTWAHAAFALSCFGVMLLVHGCGEEQPSKTRALSAESAHEPASTLPLLSPRVVDGRALIRAAQGGALARHDAFVDPSGAVRLRSPERAIEARFGEGAIEMFSGAPRGREHPRVPSFSVRYAGLSRASTHRATSAVDAHLDQRGSSAPRYAANRVEIERGAGVTEWWVAGPAGLEQGFDLASPPEGEGPIVFRLGLEGATAAPRPGGESISLQSLDGRFVGGVSHLYAEDAEGNLLPSMMASTGSGIELHVDDAGAVYPLTIDPIWGNTAVLAPPEQDMAGNFGVRVDLEPNRVAITANETQGVPPQGGVYVFERTGQGWDAGTLLQPAWGDYDYVYFGEDVELEGDTLVVATQVTTPGAATYIYRFVGNAWVLETKLLRYDSGNFGKSISLWGDRLAVGAPLSPAPTGRPISERSTSSSEMEAHGRRSPASHHPTSFRPSTSATRWR